MNTILRTTLTVAMVLAVVPIVHATPAQALTQAGTCNAFAGAYQLSHSTANGTIVPTAYKDTVVSVPACGPRPDAGGCASTSKCPVYPYKGAGTPYPGYQCAELTARYLWYRFHAAEVLGDGDQQAYKYAHTYPTLFSLVSNGKIDQAPQPGDVISMANVSSFNGADGGHVAIVQSVSSGVASTGTGTIHLIDQNDASTGLLSLTISGWSIKSWNGYSYFEWLHPKVGPTAYGYCATEGQHCSFTGPADVAYGADGRFRFIYAVNGGIDCNNTVFGDPDPGVHKACYIHPDVGPTGYTFCATEGQRCSFTGIAEVAYGADGKFYFTYASLWIDCNNTVFGDPDPGVHKACYIAP